MSEIDEGEVRALARAFARTLGHLREFQDLRYVGAAATPTTDYGEVEGEGEVGGAAEAEAEAPLSTEAEAPLSTEAEASARPEPQPYSPPEPPRGQQPGPEDRPAVSVDLGRSSRPSSDNGADRQSSYYGDRSQSPAPVNRDSEPRRQAPTPPTKPRREPARDPGAERWPAAKKLSILRERHVADCQGCRLAETRNSIVFGVGDPEADVMFIGEAPGAAEDRLSEPFVGAAGQRLDRWIEHVGLQRRQVYIANVLKCRPPNNRDPEPDEVESCSKFLRAQIRAIQPKVLIALGRFAGNFLLARELKLHEMRGGVHRYVEPRTRVEIPIVVTYHPAYVLRSEKQPPRPDRDGAIKSEDEKVLADIARAISLVRGRG